MKKRGLARNTKAEDAYVRDMGQVSAFDKLDAGEAAVLAPDDYPEPIRRFLQRERSVVRIRLSANARRKLDRLSRRRGVAADKLARKWIEAGLARETQ